MSTNGKLPAWSLGFIAGTSRQILRVLVPQTNALRAAFERKFHKPLVVTGGYRTYASQVSIFRDRYTTTVTGIDPRWWNGTLYWRRPGTAAAAVPGTSNHGWGQAIDFGSGVNTSLRSDEYWWMRNNAPAYGWTHPLWAREAVTREPWHWEALPTPVNYPGRDTSTNLPNPDGTLPDPLDPKEPHVIDDNDIQKIARAVHEREVQYGSATVPLSLASGRAGRYSELLLPMRGEIAALRSLVEQVAEATGTPIDYERIKRDVREAVADGVTIDVTVTPKTQP